MPCESIRTTNIQWGENTNTTLLSEALTAMGFRVNQSEQEIYATRNGASVRYNTEKHRMTVSQNRYETLNEAELKRSYAHQVVQSTAKRFGWALQKTTANQYTAQRRF